MMDFVENVRNVGNTNIFSIVDSTRLDLGGEMYQNI